jgi:DNA-binding transcriptional regulator YhcF (GntR family)
VTSDDSRPAYLQVANALRAEIADGLLKPGQRLPSVRDLSEKHDIAPVTARNALRVLRDEGLIYSRSTRGYFVRDDLPTADQLRGQPSPEYVALREHLNVIQGSVDELGKRLSHLEEIVLSTPAPEEHSPAPERDATAPRSGRSE